MKNNSYKFAFILIFYIVPVTVTCCQSISDPQLTALFSSSDTVHQDYLKPLREATNEIDMTVATAFLLYKKLISAQDIPKCVFTPSCSEYAVEVIQKKGLLIGWMSTFDRLSRCHGLIKPGHYHFDIYKNRFYDPPL